MKLDKVWRGAVLGWWLATGLVAPAAAWMITPEATATERGLAAVSGTRLRQLVSAGAFQGVAVVGEAVHEEITRRALQCPEDGPRPTGCAFDIRYELAGARWNDDPAFRFLPGRGQYAGCLAGQTVRMVTQPACWIQVFLNGERMAARGKRFTGANSNLLVRSHFGDLQFLHAMAGTDGEAPEQTRRQIMAWLEFTWRTAIGDRGFGSQRIVSSLPIEGFDRLFRFNRGWRIQDLFALGNPGVRSAEGIQRIAFGSLLHLVQDSFAGGHAERAEAVPGAICAGRPDWPAPGPIVEFHSYPHQDSRKHGHADKLDALEAQVESTRPTVIAVVQTLAALWRDRKPWEEAQAYLECVVALSPQARASSSGERYRLNVDRIQWGG